MTGTFTPWLAAHHLWLRPPAAARRPRPVPLAPRLVPHERVLVRETSDEGTVCVATDHAMYWRASDSAAQWTRVGWASIEQVGWDRGTHVLTVRSATTPLELHFVRHPRLHAFAEERAGAAHLMRRQVQVSASCSAFVDAVRDGDGGVTWTVRYGATCDTSDPEVTGAMDEALHDIQVQAGC